MTVRDLFRIAFHRGRTVGFNYAKRGGEFAQAIADSENAWVGTPGIPPRTAFALKILGADLDETRVNAFFEDVYGTTRFWRVDGSWIVLAGIVDGAREFLLHSPT
jgi:hypothetical protein